jgi:hypothetical protein
LRTKVLVGWARRDGDDFMEVVRKELMLLRREVRTAELDVMVAGEIGFRWEKATLESF